MSFAAFLEELRYHHPIPTRQKVLITPAGKPLPETPSDRSDHFGYLFPTHRLSGQGRRLTTVMNYTIDRSQADGAKPRMPVSASTNGSHKATHRAQESIRMNAGLHRDPP